MVSRDLKFGLFEKHTKFEKNRPYGFDKSADLLSKRQNHKDDFFKLCVFLKKSELYYHGDKKYPPKRNRVKPSSFNHIKNSLVN